MKVVGTTIKLKDEEHNLVSESSIDVMHDEYRRAVRTGDLMRVPVGNGIRTVRLINPSYIVWMV